VRNGDLRCLTMGDLADEFREKFSDKQKRDPSPIHSETPDVPHPVAYGAS